MLPSPFHSGFPCPADLKEISSPVNLYHHLVLTFSIVLDTTCNDLIHSLALYLLSLYKSINYGRTGILPILLPHVSSGTVPGKEQALSKYFENKLMIIYNLLMHHQCQSTMLNMLFLKKKKVKGLFREVHIP